MSFSPIDQKDVITAEIENDVNTNKHARALELELEHLRSSLLELRRENDEMSNDIQDTVQENDELKQRLEQVMESLAKERNNNKLLQAEKESLEQTIELQATNFQNLQRHVTEAEKKENVEQSVSETSQVQGKDENLDANLRRQLKDSVMERRGLEDMCSKLRSEREDLRETVTKHLDAKRLAERRAEEMSVMVTQLQKSVDKLCTEKTDLETKVMQLVESSFFRSRTTNVEGQTKTKAMKQPSLFQQAKQLSRQDEVKHCLPVNGNYPPRQHLQQNGEKSPTAKFMHQYVSCPKIRKANHVQNQQIEHYDPSKTVTRQRLGSAETIESQGSQRAGIIRLLGSLVQTESRMGVTAGRAGN